MSSIRSLQMWPVSQRHGYLTGSLLLSPPSTDSPASGEIGMALGGGVLMYIRDSVPYRRLGDLECDEIECLWVMVRQ